MPAFFNETFQIRLYSLIAALELAIQFDAAFAVGQEIVETAFLVPNGVRFLESEMSGCDLDVRVPR